MVAFVDVGNFAAAVPAGLLMDRMGRKFAVTVSAPLMCTGWMLLLFGRQVRSPMPGRAGSRTVWSPPFRGVQLADGKRDGRVFIRNQRGPRVPKYGRIPPPHTR